MANTENSVTTCMAKTPDLLPLFQLCIFNYFLMPSLGCPRGIPNSTYPRQNWWRFYVSLLCALINDALIRLNIQRRSNDYFLFLYRPYPACHQLLSHWLPEHLSNPFSPSHPPPPYSLPHICLPLSPTWTVLPGPTYLLQLPWSRLVSSKRNHIVSLPYSEPWHSPLLQRTLVPFVEEWD